MTDLRVTRPRKQLPFNYAAHRRVHENDYPQASGLRPATVVIAAHDSRDQTRADYVCTGTNDQYTVNQAITDCAALTSYGRILMLEGTYSITASIGIATVVGGLGDWFPGLTLEAQGSATKIQVGSGASGTFTMIDWTGAPLAGEGFKLLGVTLDGNKGHHSATVQAFDTAAPYTVLRDVTVENTNQDRAIGMSTGGILDNCTIWNNSGAGIWFQGSGHSEGWVTNCRIESNGGHGIHGPVGGAGRWRIRGNYILSNTGNGINYRSLQGIITGNHVYQNRGVGIYVNGAGGAVQGGQVVNNELIENYQEGIYFDSVVDGKIAENVLYDNGRGTANTYAQIRVDGAGSATNEINDNLGRKSAYSPKYGLWIASSSSNDFYDGNDMLGATTANYQIDSTTAVQGINRGTSGVTSGVSGGDGGAFAFFMG